MRPLHQCLIDTELARLEAIARFWDIELTTNRQRDAAAQLATAMATPEAIAKAWHALPDDQCQALGALLAAEGRMPLRVFTRRWGEIRAMGPGRLEREQPWQKPASTAEGLWYSGFISRAFEQAAEGAYEVVFVPSELCAHLPLPPTPPLTIALEPISAPTAVHSAGEALLDDECTLLAYLQNERLRPHPGGGWPAHHEARLAHRLHDAEPARLAFLRHLAQHLGWLRVTESGHLRPDPGPAADWLQSSTGQQRAALANGWRDDPTWNDLFHVPTLHPEDTGAWRNDPLLARHAILRHLKQCRPQTWYALDHFVAAVKQAEPDFQRPDGDYTSWYIRDAAGGAYLSGFDNWDNVEGALIRYLITGPLAWLGLANLGTSAPSGAPAAFCLSQAGATFLGLAEPAPEPAPAPLTIQSDFTILVPPARRYERFQLARVADWMRTGDPGAPAVYRLTPTSLERARRQGIPVARVLEFLGRATGAPIPRFIERALTHWDTHGVEARLERAVLLRLSSEKWMAEINSSPHTRRFIQEQVGPTTALVRRREWPRLIAALGEMGLLPEIVEPEED